MRTVMVTDPSHELYGRVAAVVRESKWYIHVRALYSDHVVILTKDQCEKVSE